MIKILIIIFIIFSQKLHADELKGIPKIVDGDTIYINSHKIRLEGIDAPEIRQKCKKNFLKISSMININFQKEYYCGKHSKEKLKKKIANKLVICKSSGKDRYKRYLATCFEEKINLNKWMVKSGYAVAYRRYSKIYMADEEFAKENKMGIWAGSFTRPEKWRKLN